MVFAHDTEQALLSAVELANTAQEPDTLTTVDALQEFLARYEYSGRVDGTRAELEACRAIRGELRDLLLADRDSAVDLVNTCLREHQALPQLVRHGRHDWHVHTVVPDAPLHARIQVETAMAMVDVIRADEHSRLTVCEDEECRGVVLDLSRNRSRRYCSTACGNRNAVAAYRRRQAAG